MLQEQHHLKAPARIALIFFAMLLAGALFFYKERMLFTDPAYISFLIIEQGKLQIQVGRYGAFITQVFPLIAGKMHLSLPVVLMIYSASFNLFYLAVAGILYRMRQYTLLLLMACYFSLVVSDAFFWPNNEVHQGIAWIMLAYGLLNYTYTRNKPWPLIGLILFIPALYLGVSSHMLVMVCTLFLFGFFVLTQQGKPYTRCNAWIYGTLVAGILALKYWASTHNSNGYDTNALKNIQNAGIKEMLAVFTSGAAKDFFRHTLKNYWLLLIIIPAGWIALIRHKKYLAALWTTGATAGLFILLCLTFPYGERFYLEAEFMSLTLLLAAPFVFYALPFLSGRRAMWMVVFILSVRLGYITVHAHKFTDRYHRVGDTVARMKEKGVHKLIIVRDDADRMEHELIMGWGLPIETVYYSILNHESSLYSCILLTPDQIGGISMENNPRDFILPWSVEPYGKLNKYYFSGWDTTQAYKVMKYEDFYEK